MGMRKILRKMASIASGVGKKFLIGPAIGSTPYVGIYDKPTTIRQNGIRTGDVVAKQNFWGNLWKFPFWNGRQAANDGMKSSAWVYSCIDFYTRAVNQTVFKVQHWDKKTKTWEDASEHPAMLKFDEPNPRMSGNEMVARNMVDLLVTGNFITTIIDSDSKYKKKDPTLEMWVQDPNGVKPIVERQKLISAYWFLDAPDQDAIDVKYVVHGMFIDPCDPVWGMSPMQAAARAIDKETAAEEWNTAAFENRNFTSGVFTTDKWLSTEQYRELKAQVEEQHMGVENQYRPWVLGAGMTWKGAENRSAVDVDFLGQINMTAKQVCAVYKVHPAAIGLSEDATLANLTEYIKDSWNQGVIPNLSLICNAYTRAWIRPRWGSDYRLWFDLSNVEAMKESRSQKISDAKTLWGMGVRLEAANKMLDLGIQEDLPELMISWVPSGFTPAFIGKGGELPLGYLEPAAEKPALSPDSRVEVVQGEIEGETSPAALPPGPEKRMNLRKESDKTSYWKTFDRIRRNLEKKIYPTVLKTVLADIHTVTNNLNYGHSNIDAVFLDRRSAWKSLLLSSWRTIFDVVGGQVVDWIDEHRKCGVSYQPYGDEAFVRVHKSTTDWNPWSGEMAAYAGSRTERRAVGILTSTKSQVSAYVSDGLSSGKSLEEISDILRDRAPSIAEARAKIIASNEVIAASGYASHQAAVQSGAVKNKTWLASRAENRESHESIDGQTVPLDQPYSNGLMFPGDPDGRAAEVIECECVETYTIEEG